MSGRESPQPAAQDHLRAMLHQRREWLVNRLSQAQLPAERNDEIAEEVDYLDSTLARLEDPGTPCCLRCGEPICLTRRTLAPASDLCTACALVDEGAPNGRPQRLPPSSPPSTPRRI
jgi:RNA polymerase-binding transcription factor DksA